MPEKCHFGAKNVVAANSRKPGHFDASSLKRNLRLVDAGVRKATTEQVIGWSQLHKIELSKLNDIEDKLRRNEDEIYWVSDGAALSDVEIVSDVESDDEDVESDDDERSWFPNLSGELDVESGDESESDL